MGCISSGRSVQYGIANKFVTERFADEIEKINDSFIRSLMFRKNMISERKDNGFHKDAGKAHRGNRSLNSAL